MWLQGPRRTRPWCGVLALTSLLCCAAGAAARETLPPEAAAALQRARVPLEAIAVSIHEVGTGRAVLTHRAQAAVNPASLAKLMTTAAALDLLGPAWTWSTPVWVQGPLRDGVLDGSVYIKGSGDPKLVVERLWLLLRRLQQMGVREIRGDIVLDGSAFAAAQGAPYDFDGESNRPYNVKAEALLLNYKAVVYTFAPDPAHGVVTVAVDPPLAGLTVDRTVPFAAGPCDDWRTALKASFAEGRTRFAGSYAGSCGEQAWPLADPNPASYNARLIEGLWREMGGKVGGSVREGTAPADQRPSFEQRSPPLLEVVREINKFSNNVMAQQLFLTLALNRTPGTPAAPAAARDVLRRWLNSRLGDLPPEVVIDNGSGLSREGRVTAQWLGRLLMSAYDSGWMPELMSSLPIAGVDGTLRRSRATPGRAHLKTGSLRDVAGVAGYVLSDSGKRYALVAIINHPQANAARPALDALVQWTLRDAPER
jgi:D-alanyl-D-alanine carboxypeptidase/D-alanyl-D-alanine-endopeptidase (penicillin-binding protein 4)